jgi:signal transduction histidine kinase
MSSTRAIAARAGLDALYLTIGLGTSIIAFVLWVTAVSVSLSLLVFIVGLPVIMLSAIAFRWCADLDRRNAALVLGRRLHGPYRDHGGDRFLARFSSTVRDPQTWKDLLWLIVHSVLGFGFGVAAVTAIAQIVAVAVMPLWYWAVPEGVDWGIFNIDSLWEALLVAPLAIPLAGVTIVLLRAMAVVQAKLAEWLLATGAARPAVRLPRERGVRERDGGRMLSIHITFTAVIGFIVTLLWGLTGANYFWPMWVWFGILIPLGLHASIHYAVDATARHHATPGAGRRRHRALAVQGAISGVVVLACVVLWVMTSGSYFWPVWVMLGLGIALAVNALVGALWDRMSPAREKELEERVDVLTRTRRGALDVQAAELRRIERDLHDGAQARLVALSMQLGRAEERLEDRPEVADLLRQARGEASAAIAELRDLARGIAPPVLADRGLEAAVEALGRRSPMSVRVDAEIPHRPPPVLETAAYFVVAEALTNVAKHAGPATATLVRIVLDPDRLVVEIADDGPGGADPDGGGLTGLRHRVQALDGTLYVASPPGEGTTIRAELPLH